MSNLFSLLNLGAGALQAYNTGVAVASNNTANVNTEGYSRQNADLRALRASPLVGGVGSDDPYRTVNDLLSARQRDSSGDLGMATAFGTAIHGLEGVLTSDSVDVTISLAELFAAFGDVGSAPLDSNVRDAAIGSARQLAASVQRGAHELVVSQADADARVVDLTSEATLLAQEIANANREAQISSDPTLKDRRDLAAMRLVEIVGGSARVDSDGHMRFTLPNGTVVVDGINAASFEATRDPALDNLHRIDVTFGQWRHDVTSALQSGKMAGELEFRDAIVANARTELDQLAFDLSTQINAIHRANAGLDGVAGRDLFVEPAVVLGAAAAFAVDSAVDSDSTLLAAGTVGAGPSDNQGALALVALRDQSVAAGGTKTFIDESIRFLSDIGRAASEAEVQREFQSHKHSGLADLRDSVSG